MDTSPTSVPGTKNYGLAIWSLVLGVVGVVLVLVCIGVLFAIPAVICGHIAYGRIKRSNGALGGQGLALAGLITGYVSIGLSLIVIPLLAAVAIPNFIKAKEAAQKNACINNLHMIDAAKQQWALENKKNENDEPTPEDLAPYIKGGFTSLHCPGGGTYSINSVREVPTCSLRSHVLQSELSHRPDPAPNLPETNGPLQSNRLAIRRGPLWPFRPTSSSSTSNSTTYFYFSTNFTSDLRTLRNRSSCVENLLQIEAAKKKWAVSENKLSTAVPTASDLLPYLPSHKLPVCPGGGVYTFGNITEDPVCSIADHVISPVLTP